MSDDNHEPALPPARWTTSPEWGRESAGGDKSWGTARESGAARAAARDGFQDTSMANSTVERFLGGSPIAVALRLVLLSLVVGALMMWLDIRPQDIVLGFERFLRRIWSLGFEAVREMGDYLLAGAIVVVPVWFVLRLFNLRGAR